MVSGRVEATIHRVIPGLPKASFVWLGACALDSRLEPFLVRAFDVVIPLVRMGCSYALRFPFYLVSFCSGEGWDRMCLFSFVLLHLGGGARMCVIGFHLVFRSVRLPSPSCTRTDVPCVRKDTPKDG